MCATFVCEIEMQAAHPITHAFALHEEYQADWYFSKGTSSADSTAGGMGLDGTNVAPVRVRLWCRTELAYR
jgi:hypothetical protein